MWLEKKKLLFKPIAIFFLAGPNCTKDDYKSWWPGEEFPGTHCLLGKKMVYERRIAHAVCYNGQNYDRPVSVQNCTCERENFEW